MVIKDFPRWKILMVFLIALIGVVISVPSFVSEKNLAKLPLILQKQKVNLGLDLRGGSHLLLEVDYNYYIKEQAVFLKDALRKEFRAKKLLFSNLNSGNDFVEFNLIDNDNLATVKKIAKSLNPDLNVVNNDKHVKLIFSERIQKDMKSKLIEQSIEIVRRRVDETGTKEPIIQKQGDNNIIVQVPGLENPDDLKRIIGKTAKITFHFLSDNALVRRGVGSEDSGTIRLKGEEEREYIVEKKPVLSGDLLSSANATYEQGRPVVAISFNSLGGKKFAEITKNNLGRVLAIVLDNQVISAPQINTPILNGSGIIQGNFSVKAANDLALLLRAGSLPAPLNFVEERSVGPSLGASSIAAGKKASIVGIAFVMIFMLACYGLFGLFANIALIFNMFFIIAVLGIFGATLTMPGIAAIVLTMGMAVDANVLIFERIREEMRNGYSVLAGIERGFENAFATIMDSNVTTIIAGLFLYIFAAGAVKAFAVSLIVGILTSMFTAITMTKFFVNFYTAYKKPKMLEL